MQDQTRIALDQKDVIDLIAQTVFEDDLRKWHAAAPRFDPPADAAWAETVFEHLVEIAHHAAQRFGNRLADDRTNHREQRIDDAVAIPLHGIAECRRHRHCQRVAHRLGRRGHDQTGQLRRKLVVDALEFDDALFGQRKLVALVGEQQMPESVEIAHASAGLQNISAMEVRNRPLDVARVR